MCIKKLFVNTFFIISKAFDILTLKREKKVAELLLKNSLTISAAESCTGGLISSRLTDVSGSSGYVNQNFVTYANEAKEAILGVNSAVIEKNGVVSGEVALEMAEGLIKRYKSSVAVATTGIAGPSGGSAEKAVGLIYIAVSNGKISKVYRYEANPLLTRRLMKYEFSNKAFELLFEFLKNNYSTASVL